MDDAANISVSCPMGLSKFPDIRLAVFFIRGGNSGVKITGPHGFFGVPTSQIIGVFSLTFFKIV